MLEARRGALSRSRFSATRDAALPGHGPNLLRAAAKRNESREASR